MASEWVFEHSAFTRADRRVAWTYCSDLRNQEEEPGVERIELDGPFQTGTTGRTIATDYTQEWKLTDVVDEQRFVITGVTPDGEGSLSFAWEFADEGCGTRLRQRIRAAGPQVAEYAEVFRRMERHAPEAMAQLVTLLDGLAEGQSE